MKPGFVARSEMRASHADTPATLVESQLLRSLCKQVHFRPGDVLRQKGRYYTDMYLILSGSVEVDFEAGSGAGKTAVSSTGLPIGEIGFLRGCPATATATAVSATDALAIDDCVLTRLEHEQPAWAAKLFRHLAETAEERTSHNLLFASTANSLASWQAIEVHLCRNEDMLRSAQQLRYQVYCQELGRNSPYADHDKKILADELDTFGHTFIAVEADEVIGTLRGNLPSDGPLGALEQLYGMAASVHHPHATIVCTKFIVKKSKRGTPAAMKLVSAMVRYGVRKGIKECYIDCIPALLHYYKAMGFTIVGDRFLHRENGISQPMVLDVVKHGDRMSKEPGTYGQLTLWVKAQAMKWIDAARGPRSSAPLR